MECINGGITSVVYLLENNTIRKRLSIPCPNFIEQEARILELLESVCPRHFPKVYRYSPQDLYIDMEYMGSPIEKGKLPQDWEKQCSEIAKTLANCGIYHNDLRSTNVLVNNNTIALIDYIDIKECKQGIRPLNKFYNFEEGVFYKCDFIKERGTEVDFIFEGKKNTTLDAYVDIVRTKGWKTQEEQLIGILSEFC